MYKNMLTRHTQNKITWLHLESPDDEEINKIKEEFLLPFDVYSDMKTPTLRPGAKIYKDSMYVVQHFPLFNSKGVHGPEARRYELDFVLGNNWVITTSYFNLDTVLDIKRIFDETTREDSYHYTDVGRFYIQIIKEIYRGCNYKIDELDSSLDSVEKNIYSGKERNMVGVLSQKMRSLIDIEHAFSMHDNIILDTARYGQKIYGENFVRGMNNLHSTYDELISRIKFLKDAFKEFQNTNDSLLQHKTADAMKSLTMMSFVIFPLSLIAGVFGMNASNIPIVGNPYDFEIIILIMLAVSIILFLLFKHKRWL